MADNQESEKDILHARELAQFRKHLDIARARYQRAEEELARLRGQEVSARDGDVTAWDDLAPRGARLTRGAGVSCAADAGAFDCDWKFDHERNER
jgi:hypothetical protein